MYDRRSFIATAAASVLLPSFPARSYADNSAVTKLPPKLTISQQLLYTTVRLYNGANNSEQFGTGFFFEFLKGSEGGVPAIVTNRHVAEQLAVCQFDLHQSAGDNEPALISTIHIALDDFARKWVPHPTEDLAIIPLGPTLNELRENGRSPFFVLLDHNIIPTEAQLNQLNPLEAVTTVGFPGNFYDKKHNIPLFHSGNTASAPYLYFEAQSKDHDGSSRKNSKVFLVDFTTWPGSSGSPVFIYDRNGYGDRNGNSYLGSSRLLFVGVVFGVAYQQLEGDIEIQNAPTTITGKEQLNVPTNVGACLLASQILDFDQVLIDQGLVPPEGYKPADR
ncbi:hypothetical protein DFR50_107135 [Roseiarcus fermentans]|uniref:Trypsin-like peptidase n=1 Tax=Roseiarcus fermentans TaxID=1473586 RepID=A0A366FQ61_9HYPH|nr:trypsin-like peptidase domain-containing protein [Roseiarcus fermentans]RBP15865.1 hypothetical protein DFR50_107135 [Roseiarcus fermentans]